jgi:hypothetical protein
MHKEGNVGRKVLCGIGLPKAYPKKFSSASLSDIGKDFSPRK